MLNVAGSGCAHWQIIEMNSSAINHEARTPLKKPCLKAGFFKRNQIQQLSAKTSLSLASTSMQQRFCIAARLLHTLEH